MSQATYIEEALLFSNEDEELQNCRDSNQPWKVLIVDDDEEVHILTRLVLRDLVFERRPLLLLSAKSAAEARKVLADEQDIALVLLDVVMESDDAGLQLVKFIRGELGNDEVRIILRTGQPGHAPEQEIILQYDINDYKGKTELTVQKLFTAVIASLRTYMYIEKVTQLNQHLEQKVQDRTQELEKANTRLQQSLKLLEDGEKAGKQVQFKLLPEKELSLTSLKFSHFLMPSEIMSGDFVDYFSIDDRYIGFYLADVAGHGVSSAFITIYLKRFITTLQEQYRFNKHTALIDPASVLSMLNQALISDDLGKHIAIFYAVVDLQSNQLSYANAGIFPWPVLIQNGQSSFIETKGTPVGLFDFTQYQTSQCHLADEFRLFVCSDGILDIMQDSNLEDKMSKLLGCLKLIPKTQNVLAEQFKITDSTSLSDDLTVLSVLR
ncbi:SpoIIE family protein phosphatase [Bowmanella sp. Y26]|uniref:PP2C family protein-serine/threonine phosphatase n=1 Tax=Bowmanella yangjiangensis TaxID=2811230 RepID=UPI001BDBDFB6|nr:SpoIIE family protein phosphatase [Bowmanella yangjiangensis]MBT1063850.1 SpoIIE family protein phosphatase [Bowmanella yangjiangensis]